MDYLSYLLLGAFVGFFAGLFGIGGGLVLVPVLSWLFVAQQIELQHTFHLALGTSMAAILFSASYSAYSHHRHGAVLWSVVRQIAPGLLLGALLGTLLAKVIQANWLAIFFALFVYFCAAQMLLNLRPKPSRQLPSHIGMSVSGSFIGCISSLVSVGGGVLSVPFMLFHNVPLKNAIATSAALGLPIAVGGTVGYSYIGWHVTGNSCLGFVYIPALSMLALGSLFTTPLGAKAAHRLPLAILRRAFALLLCGLATKMLWQAT